MIRPPPRSNRTYPLFPATTLFRSRPSFDLLRRRPPVFVMIAVEEPENSLSPHHLGRVLAQLTSFSEEEDAQVVLATHSPALLRRVPPSEVRHLQLDESRRTCIATIVMPKGDAEAEIGRAHV